MGRQAKKEKYKGCYFGWGDLGSSNPNRPDQSLACRNAFEVAGGCISRSAEQRILEWWKRVQPEAQAGLAQRGAPASTPHSQISPWMPGKQGAGWFQARCWSIHYPVQRLDTSE